MTTAIDTAALPQVTLGKTGAEVPLLGLGTAPGGFGLEDTAAIELFERAIDLGLTYVDTAPGYERAQSQLKHIVPRRRDELFLVSKTHTTEYQEALDQVAKNRQALGTDHLDLMYVHSLGNLDVDRVLAKDGALAGLREAQRRGWTRYVGITAHHAPWKSAKVLREAEIDVCMFALNFADRHTYNFEEPRARPALRPGSTRCGPGGIRRIQRDRVGTKCGMGAALPTAGRGRGSRAAGPGPSIGCGVGAALRRARVTLGTELLV